MTYRFPWCIWVFAGCVILSVIVSLVGYALLPHGSLEAQHEEHILLEDRHGNLLAGQQGGEFAELHALNSDFRQLIRRLEDSRFYWHPGIDPFAIIRAGLNNLTLGTVYQGASTIEQQYLKILQEHYERTWSRKLTEMLQAIGLQRMFSKDEIFRRYLNAIPFPYGRQGVSEGCLLFFGKGCNELFLSEQLFLIASRQLGTNPLTDREFDITKQRSLALCLSLFDESICAGVETSSPSDHDDLIGTNKSMLSPALIPLLIEESENGVLHARDRSLSARIQSLLTTTRTHRSQYFAEDCCVIVLDKNGRLVSLNVCADREEGRYGKVNMCVQPRQTGSVTKPLVYLYAFDALQKPRDTMVLDKEVTYLLEGDRTYTPKNFDFLSHGKLGADEALASSLNVPAVQLIAEAGTEGFIEFLSEARLLVGERVSDVQQDASLYSAEKQGLSLALGTYEMSPLSFARLWRLFLSETKSPWSSTIKQGIVEALATPYLKTRGFGLEHPFHVVGRAIKTGTSRHFVDGWACGVRTQPVLPEYSPAIVCVRMGNANSSPMKGSGAETAGYLWRLVVENIEE